MAPLAMVRPIGFHRWPGPSQGIHVVRHRLQMIGVDAHTVPTKVVQLLPIRYGTADRLENRAMGINLLPVPGDVAVTIAARPAQPHPTPTGYERAFGTILVYQEPQAPFKAGPRSELNAPRAPQPIPMGRAQTERVMRVPTTFDRANPSRHGKAASANRVNVTQPGRRDGQGDSIFDWALGKPG